MEDCEYKPVETDSALSKDSHWKYFARQAMVSSVVWMIYLVNGLGFGAPTVFIPQLRKQYNSTDAVDESMKSWLGCIFNYAALPWAVILPISASYLGRKLTFIFCCFAELVSSFVLYFSNSVTQILISEALLGIGVASITSVAIMIISEYTSPKYRGVFLTLKSATFFLGIWISNFIGTFFYWKHIATVMIVCSLYATIIALFLPESPYYLANKSKFKECLASHRWLKGSDKISEKELMCLLSIHDYVLKKPDFVKFMLSERFYKSTLLGICLFTLFAFTGKLACAMYALDIIKTMTSSEKASYTGMLILDGVSVLSTFIGSILTRFMKRKFLFVSSTTIGIISLLILSAHVYLVEISVMSENMYLSLTFLSIYSVALACGPLILCSSLMSEILPLSFKSVAVTIIGIFYYFISATIIKLTPSFVAKCGLHVVFLTFGASSLVFELIIYKYLPETKDKTLFEISNEIVKQQNVNTKTKERFIKIR